MHPIDLLEHVLATRGPSAVNRPLHIEAARASFSNLAELASLRRSWWHTHGTDLLVALPGRVELQGMSPDPDGTLVAARSDDGEICEIPLLGDGWDAGAPFMLFQERFKTRLVSVGISSAFAHGLVGALNEMASNAAEHAEAPLPAHVTYEVRPDRWAFTVTDVGRGILGSLSTNPQYAGTPTDIEAIRLAVRDGVTATGRASRGRGFTHVFNALVNRMCAIRLRSTHALASWQGTSPAAHQLTLSATPERPGFHVLVGGRTGGT